MIPIRKLAELPAGQRRRKLALLLAAAERELTGNLPSGPGSDPLYVAALADLVCEDPKVDTLAAAEIRRLAAGLGSPVSGRDPDSILPLTIPPAEVLRLCNAARHGVLAAIGTFPAEWDLIHPSAAAARDPASPRTAAFPGISVYAEDIRSPFNLGSVFRTAEAYGAARVLVSPLCVGPDHPRAVRSAMGSVDLLPWERRSLDELDRDIPVFALETGGTPIDEFDFPSRGVVILGSEELGVSPEALVRADYGRVSIPMYGSKASLNVGVAFGVLMQAWTAYLRCSASKPF